VIYRDIVGLDRKSVKALYVKRKSNEGYAPPQPFQQPVVMTAAAAESMAASVKPNAWDNHQIDLFEPHWTERHLVRLKDPVEAAAQIPPKVLHLRGDNASFAHGRNQNALAHFQRPLHHGPCIDLLRKRNIEENRSRALKYLSAKKDLPDPAASPSPFFLR